MESFKTCKMFIRTGVFNFFLRIYLKKFKQKSFSSAIFELLHTFSFETKKNSNHKLLTYNPVYDLHMHIGINENPLRKDHHPHSGPLISKFAVYKTFCFYFSESFLCNLRAEFFFLVLQITLWILYNIAFICFTSSLSIKQHVCSRLMNICFHFLMIHKDLPPLRLSLWEWKRNLISRFCVVSSSR